MQMPMYDPKIHGELEERPFAITCGQGYYACTKEWFRGEDGSIYKAVLLPDSHPMVQNYMNYTAALKACQR